MQRKRSGLLVLGFVGLLLIGFFLIPSTAIAKRWKIGMVPGIAPHPFYITGAVAAKKTAERLGMDLIWQGPETWDFAKQTLIIKALVAKGVDFLIVCPTDAKALIEPLQSAVDKGIPVITFDCDVASDLPLTNVASDNVEGGRIAGEALAKLIDYKGKVALMGAFVGVTTNEDRYKGFGESIAKYPDIEIVSTQYSEESVAKAAAQMQSVLIGHPDLKGAFAVDTPTAHGAAIGIRNAGKKGVVKLVGYDAMLLEIEDLKEGLIQVLIAQSATAMGHLPVEYAYDYLKGYVSKFPRHVKTGFKIITLENVDSPDVEEWIYKYTELP